MPHRKYLKKDLYTVLKNAKAKIGAISKLNRKQLYDHIIRLKLELPAQHKRKKKAPPKKENKVKKAEKALQAFKNKKPKYKSLKKKASVSIKTANERRRFLNRPKPQISLKTANERRKFIKARDYIRKMPEWEKVDTAF